MGWWLWGKKRKVSGGFPTIEPTRVDEDVADANIVTVTGNRKDTLDVFGITPGCKNSSRGSRRGSSSSSGVRKASTSEGKSSTSDVLNMLMFNPHGECFESQTCSEKSSNFIGDVLTRKLIDFACIVYTLSTYSAPSGWRSRRQVCKRDERIDDVTLIFNSRKWKAEKGMSREGCMDKDRRPFLVQAFSSQDSKFKVLVVAAHFPHTSDFLSSGRQVLKEAVEDVRNMSGIENLVIMADTNLGTYSNQDLLKSIGALGGGGKGGSTVQATKKRSTCCKPYFKFKGYDRVVSNFGTGMDTRLPLSTSPSWSRPNFHLPILGSLTY
jgi:hypothetical protein